MKRTSKTRFENGTPADLVLNAEVDVSGERRSGGTLDTSEIEFVGRN